MKKSFTLFVVFLFLLGAGCKNIPKQEIQSSTSSLPLVQKEQEADVVLPLDGNVAGYNPSYKRFGEYFKDRFTGYHVGEDAEIPREDLGPQEKQEVPVRAIAPGTVRLAKWVSGYGGVVVIAHDINGEKVNALYGHLDIASVTHKVGESVQKGEFIGNLGEDKSVETDGERQHLHFSLYTGDKIQLNGYEKNAANLKNWINPHDFFVKHGIQSDDGWKTVLYNPSSINKIFPLNFDMPSDWDVEYIPSLQALNLYSVSGSGTARERSQIFIRYFDADKFLTLSTVDVLKTDDLTVGKNYGGKQYEIQKKSGVANFIDQPSWRNAKHIVTDFRDKEGMARYYVVAKNPTLDMETYARVLKSMEIMKVE